MLTAQQSRLLEFIEDRLQDKGVSPSFDEMKDALGLKSKSGVHRLIKALEERGFIRRLANRARALEVIKRPDGVDNSASQTGAIAPVSAKILDGPFGQKANMSPTLDVETASIPLHGRIAAGTPIEALEQSDSHVHVPTGMIGRGECYALEVSGDSMMEKGILDGDTVVIERCTTARDGDIVVALVDREEATLKTLKRTGPHISLIPANRDYDPQVYESNRVQVQGRLVGLLRNYH